MDTRQLVLRCFAEKKGDQWQVLCLDLCLAAQADSFDEAKQKIDEMVKEYVYDALAGEDREHGSQLLLRRAPLRDWVRYYYYKTTYKCCRIKDGVHQLFTEVLPMVPGNYKHA